MLQREHGLVAQHNDAMALAERRALELNAQHPQRSGKGKMGHKMGLEDMKLKKYEDDEEREVRGGCRGGLARLVGGKRVEPKVLEEVGREALEEHEHQHEALEEQQGGILARHLLTKYGKDHATKFGKGFARAMSIKGGAVDLISGAVDTGRVADPPESFRRNTVGMGYEDRHRVPSSMGGEFYGGAKKQHLSGGCPPVPTVIVGGRKKRAPAGPDDARRRRGQVVSRLMKEEGMSLPEASKYIKENPEVLQ